MNAFNQYFQAATKFQPYPYQQRLADTEVPPGLLEIPTGLGKTEAVAAAWLWGLGGQGWLDTPRRLVWCLPMRTLVEQTRDRVRGILERGAAHLGMDVPEVHVLMGGESAGDWSVDPEHPKVLVGTQDMLLSRALNRGYGASRYRWPAEFGLLHTDVLWVYDEVQLMGAGVATSAQLEAFRRTHNVGGRARSLWMSATLDRDWLATVDMKEAIAEIPVLTIGDEDRALDEAAKRLSAKKAVKQWVAEPLKESKGDLTKAGLKTLNDAAAKFLKAHRKGTLSILISNTVGRAHLYHQAIVAGEPKAEVLLLHSRFRAADRARLAQRLLDPVPPAGRILIATQVVEAGVDLDATLLVSEVAPWSSLVQRLGRLNRRGEVADATFGWIDLVDKLAAPYEPEALGVAREKLADLKRTGSASPDELPMVSEEPPWDLVLRRRELFELFDTEPDLTGADLDVSRYIRVSDERDVLVFWRNLGEEAPDADLRPAREELCRVPIGALRDFLSKRSKETKAAGRKGFQGAHVFDHFDGRWVRIKARLDGLAPGRLVCLDAQLGGYEADRGWLGDSATQAVPTIEATPVEPDEGWSASDDPGTYVKSWVTLDDHTDQVVAALEEILAGLDGLELAHLADLRLATRWHDRGKAHEVFQETLLQGLDTEERARRIGTLWAKSGSSFRGRHRRPGFRHELASGIAILEAKGNALAAYLAASHHGKVRMALRSLPGEYEAAEELGHHPERLARGLYEGDVLPAADMGGGVLDPERRLSLSRMEMGLGADGKPSWQEGTMQLLDELGPFRLGLLEALLRAADARGSRVGASTKETSHA